MLRGPLLSPGEHQGARLLWDDLELVASLDSPREFQIYKHSAKAFHLGYRMESEDLGKTIFIGLVLIYAEWHGYCKRVGIFTFTLLECPARRWNGGRL